jgi:hypothetical protein
MPDLKAGSLVWLVIHIFRAAMSFNIISGTMTMGNSNDNDENENDSSSLPHAITAFPPEAAFLSDKMRALVATTQR